MVTVFWDVRGINEIDYIEKSETIIGECFDNVLDSFNHAVRENRPQLAKKKRSAIRIMHAFSLLSSSWHNFMS